MIKHTYKQSKKTLRCRAFNDEIIKVNQLTDIAHAKFL